MERWSTISNNARISRQLSDIVTSEMNSEKNIVKDLGKLTSNFICSAGITRENLNRKKSNISAVINADDDDEEFLERIKAKIDNDLQMHSNENRKFKSKHPSIKVEIKKRDIIDPETENVMKRFKNDITQTKITKPLNIRHDSIQSDPVSSSSCKCNDILKKSKNSSSKHENENQKLMKTKYTNIFSPDGRMKANFRTLATEYLIERTSKLQKNIIVPMYAEAGILHEEYKESRLYRILFHAPPHTNEIKDKDSKQ